MSQQDATQINIEYPEAVDCHLRVVAGTCRLTIAPSVGEHWVSGAYIDPTGTLPIRVRQEEGSVTIDQGHDLSHVPHLFEGMPQLDLALGKGKPYALTVETGAGDNVCDFGGLPLTRLTIREGAVSSALDFSTPNPQAMAVLDVNAGAAGVTLKNLSNAGATLITLQGGAAAYELDFCGDLKDDTEVKVTTGMSSVIITVPDTLAAKISTGAFLGRLVTGNGFTRRAGAYWTQAAVEGKSPVLVIDTHVALGSIELRIAGMASAPRPEPVPASA
jgi:hypothetical protein